MEEKSIFIKTFGDYPMIRVLDFLIYSRDFDYPLTEIAENSDVNYQTLKKVWKDLLGNRLVVRTRRIGNAELYRINEKNEVVQRLIELNKFICLKESGKAEKIPVRKMLVKN